jgi:hypothetical protein
VKTATEFKLSYYGTLHNAKMCRKWIKEMKKNSLGVENEMSRLILDVCNAHDIGRVIVKEITVNTPYNAVIHAVTQSPNKFMEVIISFERNNLDEWNGWEKDKSDPVIKTYSLDGGDK